ncbi:chitinase 2-like [Chenopodium quinoa]|uniref:chitinase 2-like n=1 Tax=Chenopodium quinoa TaxID=63459 RepID=UPI000B78ABDB|nr:chitinase 2-like [Chenopodium quinoa]
MASSSTGDSMLFTAYIGAMYKNIKFSDVPINKNVQFNFLLSFAIDYTESSSSPTPTNGKFNIFWDHYKLTPSEVLSMKNNHPNVRVGVSLGGDSVSGQKAIFMPSSIDSWVSNAVSSLKDIINKYHLDGIDINYEHFESGSDTQTFVECIGLLTKNLKENNIVKFVSIAPFDDDDVQKRYQALWKKYGKYIDYVNFQFYSYEQITSKSEFITYFKNERRNYKDGKILASYISDGSKGLKPGKDFFKACEKLKEMNLLHGIFFWCADDSKVLKFKHEVKAQELLAAPRF